MNLFYHTMHALHGLFERGLVPGVSYAIITSNQVINDSFGYQEIVPQRKALLRGQLYDLASLTKVIGTMPVILKLVEHHQLEISDSITDYLPQWHYPEVTIRHLLTHTSGIEGYIPNRNQMNASQLKRALLSLHIGSNFDHQMVYSDTNYIFLGWIAQSITGLPIQKLIQKLILHPLSMNDSTFDPQETIRCVPTDYTHGYTHGFLRQGTVEDPKAQILGLECGSAGLFSSLHDLTKFVSEMLWPTGKILTPQTINDLNHDQTPNHHLGRSYGWQYHCSPNYLFQAGYTGTGIVLQPDQQRGLIFLTNRVNLTIPNEKFISARNQLIQTFINE